MSDYIQDPALLEKLSKPAEAKKDEYVSDPAVLEKIQASPSGDQTVAKEYSATEMAAKIGTPAASMAYGIESGYSPEAVKRVAEPLKAAIPKTFQTYMQQPLKAAVDVMTPVVTGGMVPPPYMTTEGAKGLYNAYGAAKTSINTAQGLASAIAETPGVEKSFNKLIDALPKAEALRMNELIAKRGAQGLKEFIESAPDAIKALPEAKELAGMVPSRMAQAGKILKPVAVGAARVAGPAGLAMNIYDAQQYAEASKLGERLAEGQGNIAQQAFRNVQLNRPTPAPLTPQEAANLLQSGDQRTIDIYGGAQTLQRIASGQNDVMTQPPNAMNFLGRVKELSKRYNSVGN